MRAKRLTVLAALLAVAPIAAHAEEGWRFEPKSAADAVRIQANAIYPANLITLRLSYLDKDDGGSVAALTVVPQIAMPYALVPGVSLAKLYSIVRLEVPVATATAPMMSRVTGLGDLQFIDAAIRRWEGLLAAGVGITGRIPTATRELLGLGQLAIGPIAGVSADFGAKKMWSGLLRVENVTSVASTDDRPGINFLTVRPRGIRYLPHATYVAVEPHFLFDWKRDGEPRVLVTARAGLAVNTQLVFVIEPAWVAVGDDKNDVSVTLIASCVGW